MFLLDEDAAADRRSSIRKQNIRMMFVFQALYSLAFSICQGAVFDKYLLYLGGGAAVGPTFVPKHRRNSLVGMTESISGLSSLVLALPVAALVDARPDKRARLLKFSFFFGLAIAGLMILVCLTDVLLVVYAMLILTGVFMELSSSAAEAIFADSIDQGNRSNLFTTKAIVSTVANAVGPLISAFGLYAFGDEWQPHQMKMVMVFGSLLVPVGCLPLLFFRDPPAAYGTDGTPSPAASGDSPSQQPDHEMPFRRCGSLGPKSVPFLLATADFITCIGAGMTVKFFNLFFIEDQHFSPTQICWLQTAYPLAIAAFMRCCERLAKPLGRAQAILVFFGSSVFCLLLLSKVYFLPVLVAVYLIRGGLANSTYPIDRSILMDYTPSSQRGRWNAVESFTSVTWSGSAFVGGLLSDAHDYRFTFLITAFVYLTGCVFYTPLLGIVPRQEDAVAGPATDDGAAREVPLVSAAAREDTGAQSKPGVDLEAPGAGAGIDLHGK